MENPAVGVTRRDELIGSLLDIFLAEGFLAFNVADLAARLRCSKTTLYAIAPSKEQIVVAVVRAFFRQSAQRIDALTVGPGDPSERIGTYLHAISQELAPASAAFFAALDSFAPAREIYKTNTQIAAKRVQELVAEGIDAGQIGALNASFVGVVAGQVMESIHRGEIEAATGLDDSAAYKALAELIVAGIATPKG
ncbi:TetR/AcrR family transcriptional regulator [soil metagenome]